MPERLEIQYRDFYDIPRMFIVAANGDQLLFDGSFDEELDDYPDAYRVYRLPELEPGALSGSWAALPSRATRFLGTIPTAAVRFDPTRRQFVDVGVLAGLTAPQRIR